MIRRQSYINQPNKFAEYYLYWRLDNFLKEHNGCGQMVTVIAHMHDLILQVLYLM